MCFAPQQADFHPITPISSSWVFSSDRVIMPGWCAARRVLASDQKGPFHKHVKGTTQQRSRVGGVTLLLHLSGSGRQACQLFENLTVLVVVFRLSWVKTLNAMSLQKPPSCWTNFAAHCQNKIICFLSLNQGSLKMYYDIIYNCDSRVQKVLK